MSRMRWLAVVPLVSAIACAEPPEAVVDAGAPDAPAADASADATPSGDAHLDAPGDAPGGDALTPDATIVDAASDAIAPDASAPDATPLDSAPLDATPLDATPLDAAVDAPPVDPVPRITLLSAPDAPAGVIPIRIAITDADSPDVAVRVELSCDTTQAWTSATVLDPLTAIRADATPVTLRWDSVPDLDFHVPRPCRLRASARDADGHDATPVLLSLPAIDNLRAAAARVDRYLIHYGALTPAVAAIARTHQLAIFDPRSGGLTRARVEDVQRGVDPDDPADDVIVLCYVSVGEDIRTASLTDAQLLADPRFVGDGTGPRVDPRGPDAGGDSLLDLPVLGDPSPGGTGYASFYLDDNDVHRGDADGHPDRNAHFGGAFVNAGDPAWYAALSAMTLDGPDGVAGLDEILTRTTGRGLGCDGAFLDTYDTPAPNHFTDLSSSNLSQFEWTAAGFRAFTERLRADHPRHVFLQNRGLFFFDPRHPHFELTTGASIDFTMFESFRLDSSSEHEWHPFFYFDNRYNVAPALLAEANLHGFRVLSLGYAEGPSSSISELTLTGESTLGHASLLEDIRVAQDATGMRHYLANASLTRANTFVRDHASFDDTTPPAWTSTYNDHDAGWPDAPAAPTPRVGIRELVPGPARLTLRWDVALDLHRVHYVAYVRTTPFDFTADPTLATAIRVPLTPHTPASYLSSGSGPTRYPHEAVLPGLFPGITYHILVRAVDDRGNTDPNTRVLSAAPS